MSHASPQASYSWEGCFEVAQNWALHANSWSQTLAKQD